MRLAMTVNSLRHGRRNKAQDSGGIVVGMKSKKYLLIFTVISVLFFFTGCGAGSSGREPIRTERNFQLGTIVELSVYKGGNRNILPEAFALVSVLEDKLSRNKELSEISAINKNAGIAPVQVSDDTFFLFEKSIYYSEFSKGFFDITVGPVVSLWGIGTEKPRVPSNKEIDNVLGLIDYRKVKLTPSDHMVYLKEKGMEIDLGAIAKGYVADKVYEFFVNNGVKSAIINLGGDIRLLGKKPDGKSFRIGIQTPFDSRGVPVGIYEGEEISIITSGIYERYFEEDGIKYHHIFNPKTGYPADNDIMGITIITNTSTDGDALSTSLFMLGSKGALALAENIKDTEVIIITKDKKIVLSSGIGNNFTLTNNDFVIDK